MLPKSEAKVHPVNFNSVTEQLQQKKPGAGQTLVSGSNEVSVYLSRDGILLIAPITNSSCSDESSMCVVDYNSALFDIIAAYNKVYFKHDRSFMHFQIKSEV